MLNHIFAAQDETLQANVPLAPYTSWHIGGAAEFFCQPKSLETLSGILHSLPPGYPVTFMGLGSNVLVREGGLPGLVVHTKYLSELAWSEPLIFAQAGVTCAKLARFSCRHDCDGGAFFAGIPGTVGGALAMNAGAFGGETWSYVYRVVILDEQGKKQVCSPDDFNIGYRSVAFKSKTKPYFAGAYFKFQILPGIGDRALQRVKDLLKKRNASQPIGTFNCGSVFRNPDGDFAARLIEACDLKGHQIGGAIISEKHANFIINKDNATSEDVEALMKLIQKKVKDQFKITLEPEVRIIGQSRNSF